MQMGHTLNFVLQEKHFKDKANKALRSRRIRYLIKSKGLNLMEKKNVRHLQVSGRVGSKSCVF